MTSSPSSRPMSPVGSPSPNHFGKPTTYNLIVHHYLSSRRLRLLIVASAFLFVAGMWSFSSRSGDNDSGAILLQDSGGGGINYGGQNMGSYRSQFDHGKNPPNNILAFDMEYHPSPGPKFGIPKGADDVVLVIKTGGNVLWKRFPVHAVTTLTRTPNFLVFSDLEDKVGNILIHDSLKDVSDKIKLHHSQFSIYRTMHGIQPPPPEINLINSLSNPESTTETKSKNTIPPGPRPGNLEVGKLDLKGGWDLDKFKNIPILYQTFRAFPNKKWYIFIDADTTVLLTGLVHHLLTKYDHKKPYYLGAPVPLGTDSFAHGGSGYILSYEAARRAVEDHPDLEHAYEDFALEDCCGDHLLGLLIMNNASVPLTSESPRIHGEQWYGNRYDSSNWCEPIWTFHHLFPREVQEMWEFEKFMYTSYLPAQNAQGKRSGVAKHQILYGDLYHYFLKPHLRSVLPTWDNLSGDKKIEAPKSYPQGFSEQSPPTKGTVGTINDIGMRESWERFLGLDEVEREATRSYEGCRKACLVKEGCVQWKWAKGICALNWGVLFGKMDMNPKGKEGAWWSGWVEERVEKVRRGLWCEKNREGGFPAEK